MRFRVEPSPAGGWHVKLAELMADNRGMLRLFERLGAVEVRRDVGDLEIDVELPLDDAECLGSALRAAAAGDVAPR